MKFQGEVPKPYLVIAGEVALCVVVGHKKLIYYTASVCLTIYHSRHLDHIAIEGSVLIQAFNEVCR